MASGAVAWQQMIGYSQLASVFVNKAFAGKDDPRNYYDFSIWFHGPYLDGDNRIFLMKGTLTGDPVSLERNESQGFISVNSRTGKVNYLTRFEVLHPKGKEGYSKLGVAILRDIHNTYPDPIDDGETIIAASYTSIAKLDKKSGNLLWQTPTPGLVSTMADQGGALLAVDASGNVYVSDRDNLSIRKLTPSSVPQAGGGDTGGGDTSDPATGVTTARTTTPEEVDRI